MERWGSPYPNSSRFSRKASPLSSSRFMLEATQKRAEMKLKHACREESVVLDGSAELRCNMHNTVEDVCVAD